MRRVLRVLLALAVVGAWAGAVQGSGRPLTFQDLMKFRKILDPIISRDGGWIAYELRPDRGDGEVVVRSTDGVTVHRIEGGMAPSVGGDSRWVACAIRPTQKDRDEAVGKKKDEKPHRGMALLRTADGHVETFEEVERFALSEDGGWLAYQKYKEDPEEPETEPAEEGPEEKPEEEPEEEQAEEAEEEEDGEEENVGTTLLLRNLGTGDEIEISFVTDFAFDEPSLHLAYAVAEPGGEANGIFLRLLAEDRTAAKPLLEASHGRYVGLTWAEESSRLAFLAAVDDDRNEPGPADVHSWEPGRSAPRILASSEDAPEGWFLPPVNELTWSRDGERLFFGYKPRADDEAEEEPQEGGEEEDPEGSQESYDPYDVDALVADRDLDIWHWDDPLIIPNQKKRWEKEKDRTYRAVVHVGSGKTVPLADLEMPGLEPNDNPRSAMGTSELPYRKEMTWDGSYADVYVVDLDSGERRLATRRLRGSASFSPAGRYVAYFADGHWHLYDDRSGTTRNLTEGLGVPFANEDHDYPSPPPGYGVADWVEGDRAVLIYDKYDVWSFPSGGGDPERLTGGEGRESTTIFRLVDLDPERDFVHPDEGLLLTGYHDLEKSWGFYGAKVGGKRVRSLLAGDRKFSFVAKAEDADRILFTRESYTEFPDLWASSSQLKGSRKLSDANPRIRDFAFGEAGLVEWTSADGIPLQGVLIKPGNYEPGRRYPVLVYFYRFFSQRLHEFNEPVVNHRPSFPVYASNGYAVFLPDVRFQVGRPGMSSVKSLVPGVQKLVDLGIADPDAIGLHGHSWSGYQAAYVVTQTDIFAAAVAGAPVSNMTSAYSGIRLGSGLARQFQYEMSQSRIGVSLDRGLPLYLDNSPVFLARYIETPLLIQFGDQDEAVPWQQGIELYLAMRRLEKNVIFLQYREEPHHLKKYPNKLDYSIKMMEFFDHYLKGEPAPAWMTEGVPYSE